MKPSANLKRQEEIRTVPNPMSSGNLVWCSGKKSFRWVKARKDLGFKYFRWERKYTILQFVFSLWRKSFISRFVWRHNIWFRIFRAAKSTIRSHRKGKFMVSVTIVPNPRPFNFCSTSVQPRSEGSTCGEKNIQLNIAVKPAAKIWNWVRYREEKKLKT
jgi:hypothetical protein